MSMNKCNDKDNRVSLCIWGFCQKYKDITEFYEKKNKCNYRGESNE
jgi:hypothetical protein